MRLERSDLKFRLERRTYRSDSVFTFPNPLKKPNNADRKRNLPFWVETGLFKRRAAERIADCLVRKRLSSGDRMEKSLFVLAVSLNLQCESFFKTRKSAALL